MTDTYRQSDYKGIVIFAPQPRDEVIGTFDILNNYNNEQKITVVYGPGFSESDKGKEDLLKLKKYFNCNQMVQNIVPPMLISEDSTLYFPDPVNEVVPERRKWGYEGEFLARRGYNVIFYTLDKNVPYIYEISDKEKKLSTLEQVYPGSYLEKEIMYEGYSKWIFCR